MSKKWLAIALKFLVSGGLIWFIMKGIDLEAAIVRLREVDPLMLVLAIGIMGVQTCLGTLRWRAVTIAIEAPLTFLASLRLFYIGMFFSQALPGGTGGDAVRMYMGYRSGLPLRGAINGVMLERLATVVALVLLVDITQPFFNPPSTSSNLTLLRSASVIITLGAVFGVSFMMVLDRLPEGFRKWKIVRGLGYLADDARKVFLRAGNAMAVITWGILGHINLSFSVYLLATGLGLDVTLLDCLILVPPVVLVTTVPISIGGWGIREGAMVMAFGLINVPAEGALVLSILVGLVGLGISLPGGLVWLLGRERDQGMHLDKVEEELAASKS